MTSVTETRYVLAVPDLARSVQYYSETLGFIEFSKAPGWAFLKYDEFVLMLGECKDAIKPHDLGDHSYFAYVIVDDVDALFAAYKSRGVSFRKPVKTEPWNMREFAVETIDGHRIMFAQELQPLNRRPA